MKEKLGKYISEYSLRDNGKGYPVFSVTNSRGFCQEFFGKKVASENTSNYKVVPRGCFAYNPSRINVGSVACQNKEDYVSVSPIYVVFKVSTKINHDFLLYYLKSDYCMTFIKAYARGAVRNNLKLSQLGEFDIPVPPIAEQERIVAELDLLSGIIEKKKAQLKAYDQLAQSIFYTTFGDPITNEKGWETQKLGKLALVKTGPFGSMLHKEDYIENGVPLVNPIHMRDYRVIPDKSFTISEIKAKELSNYLLQENDIIFARRGDIGRCAVIDKKQIGYLCGTGSLFVRFKEQVNSIFIMYVIRCHSFTNTLIAAAKGVTMLNINSNTVENLGFILPPLSLQREFAEKVEAIERQKALVQQSIEQTQTMFDYTMDKYFG